MNSLERVMCANSGNFSDRPPFTMTLSLYGAKLTNCSLVEYYTKPEKYAAGQMAVLEEFGPDIVFSPFSFPLQGAAFGSEVKFFDNQAPNLKKPAIMSAKDLPNLKIPSPETDPFLLYFRESVSILSKQLKDEVPVVGITLSPSDFPAMLLTLDKWLEILLFDPESAKPILDMAMRHCVSWANTLLKDGASFLAIPIAFCNPSIITRNSAIETTIPMLKEFTEQLDGPVILHSAGVNIGNHLDLFTDLPNVCGIVLNDGDNFATAREKVGDNYVLIGKVDGPGLFLDKPETVRSKCRNILEDRKDDPRFILGTSMADVSYCTSPENLKQFKAAAEEFKR